MENAVSGVQRQRQAAQNMAQQLEEAEATRLELVPLVLEAVERLKSGEIGPREFEGALGPLRVRLQRLQGIFEELDEGFTALEAVSSVSEETRIREKREALERFVEKAAEVPDFPQKDP